MRGQMPYYFGEGDPGWDEYVEAVDTENLARAPDVRFVYVVPWQSDSVSVSFPRRPPPDAYPAAARSPQATAATAAPKRPGILARIFGTGPAAPPPGDAAAVEIGSPEWFAQYEQNQKRQAREAMLRVAVAAEAMRAHKVRRVFLRYDGGSDEGFTHFSGIELTDGRRLGAADAEARAAIGAAERAVYGGGHQSFDDTYGDCEFLNEAAVVLLGPGFGTGPFEMFGAVTIDCEACTITDEQDKNLARPIDNGDA